MIRSSTRIRLESRYRPTAVLCKLTDSFRHWLFRMGSEITIDTFIGPAFKRLDFGRTAAFAARGTAIQPILGILLGIR